MSLLLWSTYGLLVTILVYWLSKTFKNYGRAVYLALTLPGPRVVPFLGNVFLITDTKQLNTIGNHASELYGPYFRTWVLHIPLFWIYEPEHLKIILSGTKVQSEKNLFYSLAETFIGKGLITNNGHAWKKNRKALQPYFNISILEIYLNVFSGYADYVVKGLAQAQNDYTNIVEIINVAIVKSLHKAVLGIELDDPSSSPFRSGQLFAIKRVVNPWLLTDFTFKHSSLSKDENEQRGCLREYIKKAINDRRKMRIDNEGQLKNACLLDMMLEIFEFNDDFTEEDVINEAITFVLAGQDSVGAALALSLFYLARSPDVQEKAYQEINEILPHENDLKSIKLEQLNQMQYLKQCVKESLRLAPSVPLFFRRLKEDTRLGKTTFPPGTEICISPFITHRLPHYFPNPSKFDPDRFSPENEKKMHPYAYIPFSAGPRNCIGSKFARLELKVMIANVLKHYQLSLKPGTEDVTFAYRIALRAKGGVCIRANLRENFSKNGT